MKFVLITIFTISLTYVSNYQTLKWTALDSTYSYFVFYSQSKIQLNESDSITTCSCFFVNNLNKKYLDSLTKNCDKERESIAEFKKGFGGLEKALNSFTFFKNSKYLIRFGFDLDTILTDIYLEPIVGDSSNFKNLVSVLYKNFGKDNVTLFDDSKELEEMAKYYSGDDGLPLKFEKRISQIRVKLKNSSKNKSILISTKNKFKRIIKSIILYDQAPPSIIFSVET